MFDINDKTVKQKIKTNLNSTRLDELAEISMIATPEKPTKMKTPEKINKPKTNTPRTKTKSKKADIEPSPSVLIKKKVSPKSAKKKITYPADDSSIVIRPRRNVVRKPILDSDDESDKENESNWSDESSFSDSDLLTDDDSDRKSEKGVQKPKSTRKNPLAESTTKRKTKKTDKNDLVYLNLSAEEIVRVDEKFHSNVSEEDLANITRKFLETDLNDVE